MKLVNMEHRLRELLEGMGFLLSQFGVVRDINRDLWSVSGIVRCPCGGTEYFCYMLDESLVQLARVDYEIHMAERMAMHFEEHIRGEVQTGELPASWLDRLNERDRDGKSSGKKYGRVERGSEATATPIRSGAGRVGSASEDVHAVAAGLHRRAVADRVRG